MSPITKEAIARDLELDITRRAKLKTIVQWDNEVSKIYKNYMKVYKMALVKDMIVEISWWNNKSYGIVPHAVGTVNYANGVAEIFTQKLIHPDLAYNKIISLLQLILNKYAQQNILHKRISPNENYAGIAGYSFADKLPTYFLHSDEGKFYNFTIKKINITPAQGKARVKYIIKFN
jgi:hypothetical protein